MLLVAGVGGFLPWSPFTPSPAGAQAVEEARSLSLQEALDLARRNNPGFNRARNDLGVADWDVRSAYAAWIPRADVGGSLSWQGQGDQLFAGAISTRQFGLGQQPDYYTSGYQAGLSLSISGETLYGTARARAQRDATRALLAQEGRSLDNTVTEAYLGVLSQDEAIVLVEQELERARFNLRLAQARADVGSGSLLEVRQAEVEVGQSEVALLRATAARTQARLDLLRIVGIDPAQEVVLSTQFELFEPTFDEDVLYAEALEGNPGLRATRQSAAAAVASEKAARSAYFPTLTFSAGISGFTQRAAGTEFLINQAQGQVAQQIASCEGTNEIYSRLANPLPLQDCSRFVLTDADRASIISANNAFPFDFTRSPPRASLTISLPVFQGFTRQRNLEQAQAQTQDLRWDIQEQQLNLRSGISGSLAQLRAAYAAAVIQERNQELADEQLRLARERYQLGQIPFVELVDAETVKSQADRDRLVAVFDYHVALTNLEAATGRSLRTR